MADSDPNKKGGGGGCGLQNKFFRSFGPQFGLKIRGGGPPGPPPPPGTATAPEAVDCLICEFKNVLLIYSLFGMRFLSSGFFFFVAVFHNINAPHWWEGLRGGGGGGV